MTLALRSAAAAFALELELRELELCTYTDAVAGDERPPVANLPNAITLAGYAATIGWLAGGPPLLAIAGLLADEIDGRVARARGEATSFGSLLDWAVDITLTGLVAAKLGILWFLPFITLGQVWLRDSDYRPAFGSARAGLTIFALARGV